MRLGKRRAFWEFLIEGWRKDGLLRDEVDSVAAGCTRAFFAREQVFFLSGGGALAGFHLRHRMTNDLDFFTL